MFDESIVFGTDWDMWIRISKEFHFEFIDQILVKYFVHETKLSTQYELMIKGLEAILEKNRALFAIDPKSYGLRYCTLGIFYCYNRNMKKGREAFLKAIAIYPFDVRHYLNFCLSLLGANNFRFLRELREKLF
jgi:hypothetical protein